MAEKAKLRELRADLDELQRRFDELNETVKKLLAWQQKLEGGAERLIHEIVRYTEDRSRS